MGLGFNLLALTQRHAERALVAQMVHYMLLPSVHNEQFSIEVEIQCIDSFVTSALVQADDVCCLQQPLL